MMPIFPTYDSLPEQESASREKFEIENHILHRYNPNKGETEIVIPEGVTKIECWTFRNCPELQSIVFPKSLVSIQSAAFSECPNLTTLVIPEHVKEMAQDAFDACRNLKEIQVSMQNTCFSSHNGILYDKKMKTLLYCPKGKQMVTIPKSVTKIADYAFRDCTEITDIIIPDNVTVIGTGAFLNCERLNHIHLPIHLKIIPKEAFSGCAMLVDITLPEELTSIGEWAFNGCILLEKIFICATVTDMSPASLALCANLQEVQVSAHNPKLASHDGVIYDKSFHKLLFCPYGKKVFTLPVTVEEVDKQAFFASELHVSENIKIEKRFFVIIPDDTRIDETTFADINGKEYVKLMEKIKLSGQK